MTSKTAPENTATNGGAARLGQPPPAPRSIEIPAAITVGDLSALIGTDAITVIKQLIRNGFMLTVNDVVEHEIAALICRSFGIVAKLPDEKDDASGSLTVSQDEEDQSKLEPRPPVVTVLGHVDHGKTTLLDSIRNTHVVDQEAGGITQHIGAYQVQAGGQLVTFLDTPGHEAFTAMRARGAQVTDIAVLVVAADDGIMPQTEEAIDHIRAAEVPMIVAINKVDRPEADPERVKRQLAEHDLLIEEWGGDTIAVPVSALKGEGVDDLLQNVQVLAEVSEFKANPTQPARGVVVEARVDKSKGPVATVLVQTGTLEVGDTVVAGEAKGRIKAMLDYAGHRTKQAGPSTPVEILGLSGLPEAGDLLTTVPDEKTARQLVEERERQREAGRRVGVTLEEVHARIDAGEVETLALIVKTDVQGTVEAVHRALEQLDTDTTKVNVIRSASGSISEGDVLLAVASDAVIIGFNSYPEPGARTLATRESVEIRVYDIIYDLIDDVRKALQGLLAPVTRDVVEGYATVRAVFSVAQGAKAAGIYVNNGRMSRGATFHVVRNSRKLFEGPASSLRHFKDDVRELTTGLEGGIVIQGFEDYQEGDVMEAHVIQTE